MYCVIFGSLSPSEIEPRAQFIPVPGSQTEYILNRGCIDCTCYCSGILWGEGDRTISLVQSNDRSSHGRRRYQNISPGREDQE